MILLIIIALIAVPAYAIFEEWDRKRAERLHDEEVSRQLAKQAQIDEFEAQRKQFRGKWRGLNAQDAVNLERGL